MPMGGARSGPFLAAGCGSATTRARETQNLKVPACICRVLRSAMALPRLVSAIAWAWVGAELSVATVFSPSFMRCRPAFSRRRAPRSSTADIGTDRRGARAHPERKRGAQAGWDSGRELRYLLAACRTAGAIAPRRRRPAQEWR